MNASLASTYVPQGQPAMPQMQQPVGPPSQDVIARAKQGAMSVLEKINQVRGCICGMGCPKALSAQKP